MRIIATVKIITPSTSSKKRIGRCSLKSMLKCTDADGKHHSFLMEAKTLEDAKNMVEVWGQASGFTLTRLESLQ